MKDDIVSLIGFLATIVAMVYLLIALRPDLFP